MTVKSPKENRPQSRQPQLMQRMFINALLNDGDCPEKGQASSKNAKQAASALVFGKQVTGELDAAQGMAQEARRLTAPKDPGLDVAVQIPLKASAIFRTIASCLLFISAPSYFLGCGQPAPTPVHFPITMGMHDTLPERGTRIAVQGTNPLVVDHVMRWLRDHSYEPVRAINSMTSNLLVTVTTTMEPAIRGGLTPEVNIQGVDTRTGTIRLRGRAYMPVAAAPDILIADLVCQAMATAWGYRLPGQLEIPSSLMCRVGSVKHG
jgi:hypothetical protein